MFLLVSWVCWDTFQFQHLPIFMRHPSFMKKFYFTETHASFFHAVPVTSALSKLSSQIATQVTKSCNTGHQLSYWKIQDLTKLIQELTKLIAEVTLLLVCQLNGNSHDCKLTGKISENLQLFKFWSQAVSNDSYMTLCSSCSRNERQTKRKTTNTKQNKNNNKKERERLSTYVKENYGYMCNNEWLFIDTYLSCLYKKTPGLQLIWFL